MRILITGSRNWTDTAAISEAITVAAVGLHPTFVVVVHGGARGADSLAQAVADNFGLWTEVHPAEWDRYGRSAGHRRNAEMVAAGADVCLAFPLGESRGTRGCMALARKAGIRVVDYDPALTPG